MPTRRVISIARFLVTAIWKAIPSRATLPAGLLLIVPLAALAQQDNPNSRNRATNELTTRAAEILKAFPDPKPSESRVDSLGAARVDSFGAATSTEHEQWKMEFERRIYEWQFVTSKLVFCLVIGMVLAGLYFSWMHFRATLRPSTVHGKVVASVKPRLPPADPDAEPNVPAAEVTQFEAYGFKISTPVFGVVILALSLGFFYLYLQTVYPIK
jgi:hypothetical protein